MSIIKVNQDGKSHLKIVRLSEFKVNNQTYTINVQGIRVNGATHWVTPLHSSGVMRVIIMANVSTTTTGYMFGDRRFAIHFSGGNVIWNYNGELYTRPIDVGTHLFGFIDGKPYYDGSMLSSATVTASTSADACHIGSANNPDPTQLNNASIIKVELYGHETDDADVKGTWSYYATRINGNGYLIEKWANILNAHVGTQPTAATKDDGTYDSTAWGISIDDLRQVVPTGFYDVTAIYTEDGGTVSGSYVEPEIFKGTIKGTEVERKMAFRWRTDSGSTLPTGFTKQTHSLDNVDGNVTGIHGELLFGRKPTWNMWADNVNMGRYIHGNTSGSDIRQPQLRFNLLKDKYGQDKPKGFRLEDWENYSPTLYHKPDLVLGRLTGQEVPNFTMEIVNSLEASTDDSVSIQNPNSSINNRYAGLFNYKRIAQLQGDLRFYIGNMVSWHEDGYSYYAGYDGNNNPIPIPIYGAYFAVRIGNDFYGEDIKVDGKPTLNGYPMLIGYKAEDKDLDSLNPVTDASTIYTYREGGIEVDEVSFTRMSEDVKNNIREWVSLNGSEIPCTTEFGLLSATKSSIAANGGIPNTSALISGRLIAPSKQVKVTLNEYESKYPMFFINGFGNNLSVLCDSSGYSHVITQYGFVSEGNATEGIILGIVVDEDGSYVGKKVTATLTANWIDSESGDKSRVLGTVESQVRSNLWQTNQLYSTWVYSSPSYTYKSGSRRENVYDSVVATDVAQILMWEIDGDVWTELRETGDDGVRRIKPNISFIVTIDSIGDEVVEDTFYFSIGGIQYEAVQGMTWRAWVNSPYNTANPKVYILQDDYDGKYYVRLNVNGTPMYIQNIEGIDVQRDDVITSQNYLLSE